MILISKTYWGHIPFHFRKPPENARVESVTLRTDDFRQIRALAWTAEAALSPRAWVIVMHPRVDFTHHYSIPRLLGAGYGVLAALSRSPNNDTDTEHEPLLHDVAACVRFAREKRRASKVVLLGNSGGGALFAFYQAQASLAPEARLETTPAGTPTRFSTARMGKADAMIYVAAHRGPGQVLGACIDPSVVDEADPHAIDPDTDMYDVRNGFRPPPEWSEYSPEFVARYKQAQRARVERIDAKARALVEGAEAARVESETPGFDARPFAERQAVLKQRAFEPVMVIYRTMANLNYVSQQFDPSSREYGSLLSDRPDLMNMAAMGFARTCTPRAWFSTWSALSSRANLEACVRDIAEPTLMIHAGRDREVYPRTDAHPVFEAVASTDKTFIELEHARHYFEPDFGEREAPDVERAMTVVVDWLRERVAP